MTKPHWNKERADIYGMGWRYGLVEGILLGLTVAGFAVFLYYFFEAMR